MNLGIARAYYAGLKDAYDIAQEKLSQEDILTEIKAWMDETQRKVKADDEVNATSTADS